MLQNCTHQIHGVAVVQMNLNDFAPLTKRQVLGKVLNISHSTINLMKVSNSKRNKNTSVLETRKK